MPKKSILIILFVLIILGAAFSFFYFKGKTTAIIQNNKEAIANTTNNGKNNPAVTSSPRSFFVAGWLPYWSKNEGVDSLEGQISLFNEINPFAFGVANDGSLVDKININASPWPQLEKEASLEKVVIIPTILWGDARAMHNVFTNPALLNRHINAIATLLEKNNFPGVDIDYEGKDMADRDNFTLLLKTLHEQLQPLGKSLNCTIEARTEDAPPAGFSGTRAMSWANDFSALNNICDSVRVMAYDEVFQVHRANTFEDTNAAPSAPNADNQWVEEVIRYALGTIAPEKLILGIPTYGWEFQITKLPAGYRYTRVKSVTYPEAISEAQLAGVTPTRTSGGELAFTFNASDGEHLVTFSDAEAIRQKIVLAEKYNLKGISLFKLDGLTDSELYPMLKEILLK